jgi:hypothetical protein
MYLGRFVLTMSAAARPEPHSWWSSPLLARTRSGLVEDIAVIPPAVAGIVGVGILDVMQDRPGWVSTGRMPGGLPPH